MKINAILFDMGDMLFDATYWRKWLYQEILRNHIPAINLPRDYPRFIFLWEKFLEEAELGRTDYESAFEQFILSLGFSYPQFQNIQTESLKQRKEIEKNRKLFPGVSETLRRLKEMRIKLAILTDTATPEAGTRERLRKLGIESFFDAVVCSVDIHHKKPGFWSYQTAIERIGTTRKETIFVGHDRDELFGARAFGLTTIAYNSENPGQANYVIQDFPELIPIVSGER